MQLCESRGVRWLLHIDSDELFFTRQPSVLPHFQASQTQNLCMKYVFVIQNPHSLSSETNAFCCFGKFRARIGSGARGRGAAHLHQPRGRSRE